jgi:hypothetical protein
MIAPPLTPAPRQSVVEFGPRTDGGVIDKGVPAAYNTPRYLGDSDARQSTTT